MHCKIINICILSILAISANVSALSWPYSETALLNDVNEAHTALEDKTEFCMALRKRELPEIQSDWLYSLPEKKRKGILFIVSMMVLDRCTNEESVKYSSAIMRYTAETEDDKLMKDWIALNNYRFYREMFNEFSDIPSSKIIELSERPELYYPFEPMGAETHVVLESK